MAGTRLGPDMSAIVLAGDRRRAVIPTLHSISNGAQAVPGGVELIVVVARQRETELRALIAGSSLSADVVVAEPADALRAGVRAARGSIATVIDAGDLVGSTWLARAAQAAQTRNALLHPAAVLVFGRHIGWWRQPAHLDRPLLPVAVPWASPVVARRPLLAALADAAEGRPRERVPDDATLMHGIVPATTAFVRAWDAVPPWEIPAGELLPASSALRDVARTRRVPPLSRPRSLPRGVASIIRIARSGARPWVLGVGARLRRRQGLSAYPPALIAEWRSANKLEPLVPFPRGEYNVWHRVRPANGTPDERSWADAYARLVAALPERIDYLFFAPWLRLGGGDTVTITYINAVRRLDSDSSVVLLTTEPVESTSLRSLDPTVTVVELRTVVDLNRHRTAIVERILPQLIAQYRPTTIHAFNSTVGFDIVEQIGDKLAEYSHVYLSSFAIDRDPEGERTSVMFLRRPGFLDPVSRVLVDSQHYVDSMVREFGYDRGKFAIQNHVVDLPLREREEPAVFDAARPLRVLWAGRFDLPKRLDVLAEVAEAVQAARLPVVIEFHGGEVMGHPGLDRVLRRLAEAGAVRNPPYAGFRALQLERYDAYLMTSEWEGVPHTALEAMAVGIPVVAPLVGGIGEVLDRSNGYPVERFDDAGAYLAVLREILEDAAGARARATRARERIVRDFSLARFERTLRNLPGYLREVAR